MSDKEVDIDYSQLNSIAHELTNGIPTSWLNTTLGAPLIWGSGGTPKSTDPSYYGGPIPWLVIGDLNDDFVSDSGTKITELGLANSSAKLVEPGTILLAMYGSIGKMGIASVPLATNQAIAFTKPDGIVGKYLFYFLQFAKRRLASLGKGATQKNISQAVIKAFPFVLAPYAEQQRIVTKIEELFSELDKAVENLRTAQQQLKVYRQALLKHAFEGKLTDDWRAQNPDKLESVDALLRRIHQEREARYQQQLQQWEVNCKTGSKPKAPKVLPALTGEVLAELPELPLGWVYVKAEEICGFITKGTTPSKELLFDGRGEVPFIKVYNLTKTGALDFTISPTFVSRETHNSFLGRSKVFPGDVLMNIVGPPLGKVSVVPDHHPEWNINQAVAIFRTDLIKSKVLAAFLASETTVRRTMRKSKATAGQFNLTLEICREIVVPVCSISEQIQLAQELEEKSSILDQLEQTITHSLQQAEALRQSILKKAFSGQLVPQDPNDEPASVLLERIRAERAAQPKARGRKAKASV